MMKLPGTSTNPLEMHAEGGSTNESDFSSVILGVGQGED